MIPRTVWRMTGAATLAAGALLGSGCMKVQMEHRVHVDPIEATINVNLRVQRELEDVFDFRWKDAAAAETAPATGDGATPSTQPAAGSPGHGGAL